MHTIIDNLATETEDKQVVVFSESIHRRSPITKQIDCPRRICLEQGQLRSLTKKCSRTLFMDIVGDDKSSQTYMP